MAYQLICRGSREKYAGGVDKKNMYGGLGEKTKICTGAGGLGEIIKICEGGPRKFP